MMTGTFEIKILAVEDGYWGDDPKRRKVDHHRTFAAYDLEEAGHDLMLSKQQAEGLRDWLDECLNDRLVVSKSMAGQLLGLADAMRKRVTRLVRKQPRKKVRT